MHRQFFKATLDLTALGARASPIGTSGSALSCCKRRRKVASDKLAIAVERSVATQIHGGMRQHHTLSLIWTQRQSKIAFRVSIHLGIIRHTESTISKLKSIHRHMTSWKTTQRHRSFQQREPNAKLFQMTVASSMPVVPAIPRGIAMIPKTRA